jgi:hypothetical protein
MSKETINKVRRTTSSLILRSRSFGFNVAFWSFLSTYHNALHGFSRVILRKKHKSIKDYLYHNYTDIINRYDKRATGQILAIDNQSPIWICWWDGVENMPAIIKACFHSVCINSAGHQVNLITKSNYRQYVQIPANIVEKLDQKIISITHFSDILRVSLLCQHGGFWMDATILMTKPLSFIQDAGFFTIKHKDNGAFVSECRWTGFCIGGNRGNILFNFLTDMLFEYWRQENSLIEYLLLDYLIAIAYESVSSVKQMVDRNPFNNLQLYGIRCYLNSEFNQELLETICSDTSLHKLTWKDSIQTTTFDGKPTFYGHILTEYTPDP